MDIVRLNFAQSALATWLLPVLAVVSFPSFTSKVLDIWKLQLTTTFSTAGIILIAFTIAIARETIIESFEKLLPQTSTGHGETR